MTEVVVVMGVTGAGKSTVGRLIADALGVPFLDADDFHDDAAKAKMRAGVPLTDADRQPWLDRLNRVLHDHAATGAVLACSALTAEYRQRLAAGLAEVRYVLLTGDPELIRERIAARHGHFAGTALLPSQLEALDAPAEAITVDVAPAPDVVARRAVSALRATRPGS